MSIVADAIQPFLLREFISLAGRTQSSNLSDIFISERAAYGVQFDDASQSVTADFREPSAVVNAFAADCCRFSFAAFQTISQVSVEIMQRDCVAWSLLKTYYSAFYAGHALLRTFGEACTFFDREHVTKLQQMGAAYGQNPLFPFDTGLYRCAVNADVTAITCTKTRGASGIHEAFWTVFGSRIQAISDAILTGLLTQRDAQAVFAQFTALINVVRRRTGYSWLSNVRNDLQYRQSHGVWFPARLKQNERLSLSRLIADWRRDPMKIDLDVRRLGLLGDFAVSCVFIVALCHTMLRRIADRSSAGRRSFVSLGPITYLNHIGIRADED